LFNFDKLPHKNKMMLGRNLSKAVMFLLKHANGKNKDDIKKAVAEKLNNKSPLVKRAIMYYMENEEKT